MDGSIRNIVHATSASAAAIAAVLSPFPLLDELVLGPLYGAMAFRIGRLHQLGFGEIPWRPVVRTTVNGLIARAGANVAVAFIPGVAAAANAVTAAALGEWLGHYVDESCASPADARVVPVRDLFERMCDRIAALGRRPSGQASHAA